MINIYTIQFSDAEFLELQYRTFKKFLKEPHQLICINNVFDKHSQGDAIIAKANELGIPHYIPYGVDHSEAGRSHQTALNWTWKNLIEGSEAFSIIVDHDMFPIKPFAVNREFDIYSIMQGRGNNIRYFHPGLMMINVAALTDRSTVDFRGDVIDGYACDSGGNWHHYLNAHPNLKIHGMNMVNICQEQGTMDVLPETARQGYNESDPFQICDDFMFHFRNGSNWAWTEQERFNRKKEQLRETIEYYMNLEN